MEFTLFYKGNVYSPNAKVRGQKISSDQRIRKIRDNFHKQLKELWTLPPLLRHHDWMKPGSKLRSGKYVFLISKDLEMYAKLNIQVLLGCKDRRFKDIDNKLKTICDALRVPTPHRVKDSTPFFCLLKDDESIYQLSVDTDYLLCQNTSFKLKQDESMWVINVKIKGNQFENEYMDLLV